MSATPPFGGAGITRPANEPSALPRDAVPILWAPRAATISGSGAELAAETLFDGDGTTGFTSEGGSTAAVRLDLGTTRQVMGVGVHGTGHAKVSIYVEENGDRRLISGSGGGPIKLDSSRWAQVVPTAPTEGSALVVEWTAPPGSSLTVTELALWVAGRSRG